MPLPCPSCRNHMTTESYFGHYGRQVEIDVCHHCNTLWFDKMESPALSPGAVVKLIGSMHEHHVDRVTLADALSCPRCSSALRRSARRTKDISYTVHDCPERHGHFITFYEFLREKDCVRPLRGDKLKALRANVGSVQCSNCGASVDLHRTTVCDHCQAPLVLLDPDAMSETLDRLQATGDRRTIHNADQVANQVSSDMVLARLKTERNFRDIERVSRKREGTGLLEAAFFVISRLLS